MSEFRVQVIEVGKVGKHPNADSLSITQVLGGYPVIFRTGDFEPGDKAAYIPVDAIVPENDSRWEFLGGHNRIKAKKLRGIFSMGLLTPADPTWEVGQIVQDELRILKYEPPLLAGGGGNNERCPFDFPCYTDIDGYRKYPNILKEGEEVILTEKLHGANGRYVWKDGRLWVGSHKCVKAEDDSNMWWAVAKQTGLVDSLSAFPEIVLYGEVYGYVQDLKYGAQVGQYFFRAFDALNLKTMRYLDWQSFTEMVETLKIDTVPVLYRGPWNNELIQQLSNGKSTLAEHTREGFVAKPPVERWNDEIGRVILKFVGEDYLLRKESK